MYSCKAANISIGEVVGWQASFQISGRVCVLVLEDLGKRVGRERATKRWGRRLMWGKIQLRAGGTQLVNSDGKISPLLTFPSRLGQQTGSLAN